MSFKKEWTKEEVLHLINLYEENELLWNTKNVEYRNREKKLLILKEIAANCECTEEEVNRKLHNLRSQMSQEIKKEKRKKSGMGIEDVYTSTWPFYTSLGFLFPSLSANKTKSTDIHIDQSESLTGNEMIENVDKETEVFQKKRKLSENDKADKLLETALKTMQTPLNNDERFGQYVAMELNGIADISIKKKIKETDSESNYCCCGRRRHDTLPLRLIDIKP